jgi:hypothetical protein
MARRKAYKLAVRYEITAHEVDDDNPGASYFRNDERLTIEDTFDLANAMRLTEVLKVIDQVHDVIRS